MAKFYPSNLAQSNERKGSNFAAQRNGAIVLQAQRAKCIQSKNLAIAIWQPFIELPLRGQIFGAVSRDSRGSVGSIVVGGVGAFAAVDRHLRHSN